MADKDDSQTKKSGLSSLVSNAFGLIASLFKPKNLTAETDFLNKTDDGFALKGYDAVAYFTENSPRRGKPEFYYEWNGARWLFANAVNRDKFIAEPEQHMPQFGGYCAYAIARNNVVDIDPTVWKIVDGRLYLNYNKSVAAEWEQDLSGSIERGERNWRKYRNRQTA